MRSRALHDALSTGASDSVEHKALSRAISKADGDRDRAIRNVCRLYHVKDLEALPLPIRFVIRFALPA